MFHKQIYKSKAISVRLYLFVIEGKLAIYISFLFLIYIFSGAQPEQEQKIETKETTMSLNINS